MTCIRMIEIIIFIKLLSVLSIFNEIKFLKNSGEACQGNVRL